MPELPEVETMRRGILGIVGSTILEAKVLKCACRPIRLEPGQAAFRRRTMGQQVVRVDRLGKRVVVHLASADAIVFEPRMTGLVLVADPPSEQHLRFRLAFRDGSIPHVWYWDRRGLGSVRLMTARQIDEQLGGHCLGPDALVLDSDQLQDRLRHSRRAVKVALLDQRAIAGIGNLYASEILHVARIRPTRRCDRLRAADWQRIHSAMQQILHEAILHEGSTLSDGTYRNALNKAGGYQNLHRVYDRAGERCPSCQTSTIRRIVQAQRSTFYCTTCQR